MHWKYSHFLNFSHTFSTDKEKIKYYKTSKHSVQPNIQ